MTEGDLGYTLIGWLPYVGAVGWICVLARYGWVGIGVLRDVLLAKREAKRHTDKRDEEEDPVAWTAPARTDRDP